KAQRERWRQWQEHGCGPVRVSNTYGPTEATVVATSYEVNELGEGAAEIPIGRAVRHAETYVLDGQLQPVPIGVAGELYLGGLGLGRGYQGGPALTAEKFVPHPFSGAAGARLYQTGDRVRYSAAGQLEFLGRMDQQLKLRGYRIEPGEIETALRAHAGVEQALVLLREAGAEPPRLVAYVQPSGAQKVSGSELRGLLQQQLPAYMVPSALVLLEQLPRTASGKVDRAALPEPGQFQSESFVAPRNPLEELVAEIWSQVLKLPQVGVADNFFHLGGHSLLATQVISRVREVFGVEVSLRAFFESATVAGLCSQIDLRRGGQAVQFPAIERISRDQLLPLSFSQERLWFIAQLDPDNTAYHVPRAIRITGELDVDLVRATFNEILRRHEILRTSFPTVDGRPVQVIHAPHALEVPLIDVRSLPQSERETQVQQFIRTEGNHPFDFHQEPLIRVSLLQLDEPEHVLVLTEHHLVHDGWTQGVLMRDFVAVYSAFRLDQPSPLPDLEIQYADFAHWQRRWLQGGVLEDQLEFWKKQLHGAPPFLELPSVRPRLPVQSFRGAEFNLELDAGTADALREFSRNHGVTLFMTMLAAF